MVSFEIPLILSLLGVVLLTGTLNLSEIVESQASFPWIIFMPIGAIVFFTAMLAELERIPFDLPEAESEIVAGWLTEFSGMMYGLVQLGSYVKLFAFAALFVTIFLGGWSGPIFWPPLDEQIITEGVPIPNFEGDPILTVNTPGLPLFDEDPNEWVQQKRGEIEFTSGQLFFSGTIWFILKTVAVIFFVLLPRGVFPRIRIDMLLHIGWYKLIGLAFVNIFIALGLLYAGVLGPEGFL